MAVISTQTNILFIFALSGTIYGAVDHNVKTVLTATNSYSLSDNTGNLRHGHNLTATALFYSWPRLARRC